MKNKNLSWHIVEKAIAKERDWLLTVLDFAQYDKQKTAHDEGRQIISPIRPLLWS